MLNNSSFRDFKTKIDARIEFIAQKQKIDFQKLKSVLNLYKGHIFENSQPNQISLEENFLDLLNLKPLERFE